MSLIFKLPDIIEESRLTYKEMKAGGVARFRLVEQQVGIRDELSENMLVLGENLEFMLYLLNEGDMRNRPTLIYIDPPFYSGSDYDVDIKIHEGDEGESLVIKQKAYSDIWGRSKEEYLKMLTLRFLAMKDLLAEDGSLWVHLDWHAVHYVKIILDEIFGEENFINEIIWQYKSGGAGKRCFARKHDTLLYYAKSPAYYFKAEKEKSYNRGLKPYRFKGVEEFCDEIGWHTMVTRKDVWQIDMVGRTSSERTGYATQKPETLIERILESCTQKGDLCADFFAGSGTLAAVANRMGRRWISCDVGKSAILSTHKRLMAQDASYGMYIDDGKDGLADPENKLNVVIKGEIMHDAGDIMLTIRLKSYDYGGEIPLCHKNKDIIGRIMEGDSLCLLASIGIDRKYDGKIFRPDICNCNDHSRVKRNYEIRVSPWGTVAVRVLDIFGNRIFFKIQVSEFMDVDSERNINGKEME
ncbi:MAG: DNA methyltransferase [Anaerovoracaceae bacterium]